MQTKVGHTFNCSALFISFSHVSHFSLWAPVGDRGTKMLQADYLPILVPTHMNRGHVCICHEYLQHSVAFGRGRLKMTCLSGKLLFVIHLGGVGSVTLRQLGKMVFKRISSSAQLHISLAVYFSVISKSRVAKSSGSPRGGTASPSQYFGKLSRPSTWYGPCGWGSRAEAQRVDPPHGAVPQLHSTTDRLPADPSSRFGGRWVSRICCSWSHCLSCSLPQPAVERLGVWGAIYHVYMGHNVGYLHV